MAKETSCKAGKEKVKGRCVKACGSGKSRNSTGKCSVTSRKTRKDKGAKRGTRKLRAVSSSAPFVAPIFGDLSSGVAATKHSDFGMGDVASTAVIAAKKRKTRKDKGAKRGKRAAVIAAPSVGNVESVSSPSSHHTPELVTALRGKLDSHGDLKASPHKKILNSSDSVSATPKYGFFGRHINKGERRRRHPLPKSSSSLPMFA